MMELIGTPFFIAIVAIPLVMLYYNYSAAESIKRSANLFKEGYIEEATSELHRAGSIWSNLIKVSIALSILYTLLFLANYHGV